MAKKWQIKEVSKQSKLSEDTIRFYEKEGLIKPVRGDNGYRQYSEKELTQLKYIAVMKYAHFSIKEIRALMDLMNSQSSEQCNARGQELLQKKVKDLKQAIDSYQQIITLLQDLPMPESYAEFVSKSDAMKQFMDQFIEKIFRDIYKGTANEDY